MEILIVVISRVGIIKRLSNKCTISAHNDVSDTRQTFSGT